MRWSAYAIVGAMLAVGTGCAVNFAKRSPWDIQQLQELSDQLEHFKTLAQLNAEEAERLRQAKADLESRLSSSDVSIGYDERGLVARMLDRVLFDSGKAKLRRAAYPVLDKVAQVLKEFPGQPVGIEGHTDNLPIRFSGWPDNKALAEARAQAVADYMTQQHRIGAGRLTVIGYGEDNPIAPNDTAEGRALNRRVELVILPEASGAAYKAEAKRVSEGGTVYSK
jgi:chemotaxis protein MotB